MEKSRLIALFKTLSNKEVRELRKFLHSPFFNKRNEVCLLFEYLVESINIYKVAPSKEKAFAFVKKGTNNNQYEDQSVRLWMSFLFKLMEQYLVHTAFFEDEIKIKTQLTAIYRNRNLPIHQERSLLEVKKTQLKRLSRDAEYYIDDFQIQLEQYKFTSASRRMSELNLQQVLDNLDIAYLAQKLRQSCLSLSHQAVFKTEYRFGLLNEILEYVKAQNWLEIPAIAVYYYCYYILTQPQSHHHFQAFKNAIVTYQNQFPADELGDLYILAINFCIKRYNEGNTTYLKDEFEIYQQGLQQGLFLKNNILSRFTYSNVVTVGLVLKEFEWVEQFIYDYKSALDKTFRDSMFSVNLARLEYERKNYKAAMLLLQTSEYKDILLNLAAKSVMLKIYYELDEYDLLDAHLGAMRTFIRRKKDIAYHEEIYVKLIYFTKKLMDYNPYDKAAKQALLKEIEETKSVAQKAWLVGMLSD